MKKIIIWFLFIFFFSSFVYAYYIENSDIIMVGYVGSSSTKQETATEWIASGTGQLGIGEYTAVPYLSMFGIFYIYNVTPISCAVSLSNTSYQLYLNESCYINDTRNQTWQSIQYDLNRCGAEANQTFNQTWFNETCDYCTFNITNTTGLLVANNSCYINDTRNQSMNITEYDYNYLTCANVTGIASDYWNSGVNNSYNVTWFNETCNYCSYNLTNTSYGSWTNVSCSPGNLWYVAQNLTQYDSNYTNCYALTGLASDLFGNLTFYNYNYSGYCQYSTGGGGTSGTSQTPSVDKTGYEMCGKEIAKYQRCFQYNGTHCNEGCPENYYCSASLRCIEESLKICDADEELIFDSICVPSILAENIVYDYYNKVAEIFPKWWIFPSLLFLVLMIILIIYIYKKKTNIHIEEMEIRE